MVPYILSQIWSTTRSPTLALLVMAAWYVTVLPSAPALQDVRPVPVLSSQLLATPTITGTAVMGREMMLQLHFDGDPGIAVGVPPGPLLG